MNRKQRRHHAALAKKNKLADPKPEIPEHVMRAMFQFRLNELQEQEVKDKENKD